MLGKLSGWKRGGEMITQDELGPLLEKLRADGGDNQEVEVKEAVGGLPSSLGETVSAFANGTGGLLVLGVSEDKGFVPAQGFDAKKTMDAVANLCSNCMTPPVRPLTSVLACGTSPVLVVEVPELSPQDKPCYIASRGLYRGAYIRVGDGDRRLSPYEIDRLLENRKQPRYDLEPVEEATVADLNAELVEVFAREQRHLHPRAFSQLADEDVLIHVRALVRDEGGGLHPTLAGLLAFGTYPQYYFPTLSVTFTRYPGTSKASASAVKFLDDVRADGPIPVVLEDILQAVSRNIQRGGVLVCAGRQDVPEYPIDAVREAVVNAIMHRDYSPQARGSLIQVNMYSDRLEVLSPGGLYGGITASTLGTPGMTASRNQHLSALLESLPFGRQGHVAENRGSGFELMNQELAASGMLPPLVSDSLTAFRVTFVRSGSLEGIDQDEQLGRLESMGMPVAPPVSAAPFRASLMAAPDPPWMEEYLERHPFARRGREIRRAQDTGRAREACLVGAQTTQGQPQPARPSRAAQGAGGPKAGGQEGAITAMGIIPGDPVISYIEVNGRARARDISDATGIPRSTVAYRLKKLVDGGLVERTKPSKSPQQEYRLKMVWEDGRQANG